MRERRDEFREEVSSLRVENHELERQENESTEAWRACRKERDRLKERVWKLRTALRIMSENRDNPGMGWILGQHARDALAADDEMETEK